MDQIIIKDLLLRGIVGINPDERVKAQDILINVIIFADTRRAGASDDIADAVNYKTITKRIIDHVENGAPYLVERLVNEIAGFILAENPAVTRIRVRVEKPTALRFAASVGIEIDRQRDDVPGNS